MYLFLSATFHMKAKGISMSEHISDEKTTLVKRLRVIPQEPAVQKYAKIFESSRLYKYLG